MKITAIVAARGGSVRLPRKALLPFGEDTTLIARKVRQLKACALVDHVVVNTDDIEIGQAAIDAGADLIHGKDYAAMGGANEMLRDSARQVEGDAILWAHPTNPLVGSETYDRAIRAFFDLCTIDPCPTLASVTPIKRHAWFRGEPLNHDPLSARHQLAAELEPVLFQDGAIFIRLRSCFERDGHFVPDETAKLFELDPDESIDIDTDRDYRLALAIEHMRKGRP